MTLDLETQRLIDRVRAASLPDEERVTNLRTALLLQLPPSAAHEASAGTSTSTSTGQVAGSLSLAKWTLAGLFAGSLVLGGVTVARQVERQPRSTAERPRPNEVFAPPVLVVPAGPAPAAETPLPAPRSTLPSTRPVRPAKATGSVRPRQQSPEDTARAQSTLGAQVELLTRAVVALRELRTDEARSLLELHVTRYPDSPLLVERERAFERLTLLEQAPRAPAP